MTVDRKAERRPYRLKERARRQEETRRRITEAAIELHGSVGAARTTISAIAERAGVERLTVYRHFADESALLAACSSHWIAAHPSPDPSEWPSIRDPAERLRVALAALYAYYDENEAMLAHNLADAAVMPALAERMGAFTGYLGAVRDILAAGWGVRGRRRDLLLAALGHAVDFETWRSLARRQGLSADDAEEVMISLVEGVARRR